MTDVLLFLDLNHLQQKQVARHYNDARYGDGYLYELDSFGIVVSRHICWFAYEPDAHVTIDRVFLEKALDFMISIEPDPESLMTMADYKAILKKYKNAVEKAESIIRLFGEQIGALEPSRMEEVFYEIINSEKYSAEPIKSSVVQACLRGAWAGVGGWA